VKFVYSNDEEQGEITFLYAARQMELLWRKQQRRENERKGERV
jgi:hypothetical protein